MPVSSADWFVYAEQGGLTRDYVDLHTHTMPGAADQTLLQNAVTMVSHAQRSGNRLEVEVNITNDPRVTRVGRFLHSTLLSSN